MSHRFPDSHLRLDTIRAIPLILAVITLLVLVGCSGTPTSPSGSGPVDQVVVKKSQRKLQLLSNGSVIREYRIALGDAPIGHKFEQGDERTPEGDYILDWRNPYSRFHKSIHVSYPNPRDRALARFLGVDPGGMIMVHGQPNHIRSQTVRAEYARYDWTDGCIAVQDDEMDEIWRLVPDGTPIRILR